MGETNTELSFVVNEASEIQIDRRGETLYFNLKPQTVNEETIFQATNGYVPANMAKISTLILAAIKNPDSDHANDVIKNLEKKKIFCNHLLLETKSGTYVMDNLTSREFQYGMQEENLQARLSGQESNISYSLDRKTRFVPEHLRG